MSGEEEGWVGWAGLLVANSVHSRCLFSTNITDNVGSLSLQHDAWGKKVSADNLGLVFFKGLECRPV